MKVARKLWTWALALVATFAVVLGLSTVAMAAAGGTPPHTKILTDNHDGTYTLSLDVVGESERKPNPVNVIVILDHSGSMDTRTGGYGSQTRMAAAQNAVNNLARSLFSYNTSEFPNLVQMALVGFSTTGSVTQAPTTSYNTFSGAVNGLDANGGTNWEDALQDAAGINFGDQDPTYVIFVSDGNPTFRMTLGSYDRYYNDYYLDGWGRQQYGRIDDQSWLSSGVYGNGQDITTENVRRSYNEAVDDARSLATTIGADHFYTIGAYGNVDRMQSLTTAAGAPAGNYFSAANTTDLQNALAAILAQIEKAGIGSVEIEDGTTNQVTASSGVVELLEVDTSSFKYYKDGQPWAEAPEAVFVDGAVKWDLSSVGVLDDGVKYTVTFDCYPSQYTYDTIAQLKNGDIKYFELDPEVQKYIVDNENGTYSLRTNTAATLDWDDTRTDENEEAVTYDNPDPVRTDSATMSVSKEWENQLDARAVGSIEMTVLMDNGEFHKVTLSADDTPAWTAENIYISPGIIKNGQVLPGAEGHDFTFAELGSEQYNWELVSPIVHPMLINGTLTMLTMVDDAHPAPSGATTYQIKGADGATHTYYSNGTSSASLNAYNYRRSNLNLTKVVTGEDAPENATFPFTLTVNNSKASSGSSSDTNSDYYVWFSIYDTNASATVMNATVSGTGLVGPSSSGYYYIPSGTAITVQMKAGWNLRFTNLPTGTTYTFAEGNLATGFAFNKAELTSGTDKDTSFSGGKTTTGTIQATNTSYVVTFTNDYQLTDLEITKVWNDANNQDGMRLTAEQLAEKLTLSPEVEGKTPTVTDNGDGTYTITYTGLPRFNNGQEVEYQVTESAIDGYTTTGSPAKDHGTITNTHTPEVTSVKVTKVWDDSNDAGKIRPTSVSVQLTADGVASGDPVTLNEGNQWTYTWENLPKYKNGTAIVYAADETAVPTGYTKTVTGDAANGITITNKYTPTPITASFPVKKTISVPDGLTGPTTWSYTINVTANNGAPEAETMSGTVSNTTDTVTFGDFTFTMPGTYTYTVSESGDVAGVTNDTDAAGKTVTITVVDDGTGKLTASVEPAAGITFTNTYGVEPTTASFPVEKILSVKEGLNAPDITGKYTITLAAVDGAPMPTTTSYTNPDKDGGTVTFGTISYDKPGTYTYTVTESGEVDGVTNDSAAEAGKTITVTVVDNGDGTLTATPSTDETPVSFTNTYQVGEISVSIPVKKEVEFDESLKGPKDWTYTITAEPVDGAPVADEMETTVTKASPSSSIGMFTFTEPGTYTYTVTETGTVAGVTNGTDSYDVDIVVTDNGDGSLSAVVNNDALVLFTNTYNVDPVTASFPVKKTLDVPAGLEGPEEWSYDITVNAEGGAPEAETMNGTVDQDNSSITFGEFTFNEPGTYTYTVSESGDVAGVTNDTDAAGKTVTITVVDNQDGTLSASVSPEVGISFTNTYDVQPTTASFPVAKNISVPEGMEGPEEWSYDISVTANGDAPSASVMSGAVNQDSTSITFGPITYDKPGTYTYTVTESGSVDGVTNDPETSKTVTVTVEDDLEGGLTASVSPETGITFNNTYNASGEATITVSKALAGAAWPEGKTLTLTLAAEGDAPLPETTTATLSATGSVSFGPISYSAPGTYTYTVSEDGFGAGWTGSGDITVTVKVEDKGDGTLVATPSYSPSATITNTYKPSETTAYIPVEKIMSVPEGLSAADLTGKFTFTLTADEGTPMPETTSYTNPDANGGTVTFGSIAYTQPGTYNYTVTESGSADGVTNDPKAAKTVTVDVKDNGDGTLSATSSSTTDAPLTFTNTLVPAKLDEETNTAVKVTKTLYGRDSKPGETFTFTMSPADSATVDAVKTGAIKLENDTATVSNAKDGQPADAAFGSMTFAQVGTYTFNVSEDKGTEAGMSYDADVKTLTVTVTDQGGKLVAVPEGDLSFTNTYTASGSYTPQGTKQLLGNPTEPATDEDNATPEEPATNNEQKQNETADVQNTEKSAASNAESDAVSPKEDAAEPAEAEKADESAAVEEQPASSDTATTESADATAAEDTAQTTADINPVAALLAPTQANAAEPEVVTTTGSFAFFVTYANGNAGSGLAGSEASRGTATVEYGKIANIAFNSISYKTGRADEAGTLEYLVANGAATKNADGSYDITYLVKENKTSDPFQLNTQTFTFTVHVVDNGNGTLAASLAEGSSAIAFVNHYLTADVTVSMSGLKVMNGTRSIEAGDYSFTIKGSDGAPMPAEATVKNAAGGSVDFGTITFTKDDLGSATEKTFTYTITEDEGDKPGVSYSDEPQTVTVTVKDNGDGTLSATTNPATTPLFTITNTYTPTPSQSSVTDQIKITKELTGRDLTAGEFTFQLKDADGNVVSTATNAADGTIIFNPITFTEVGTYTYTVSEVNSGADNITYDDSVYTVTATVTDNGDGTKSVVWSYEGGSIVFKNTYTAPAAPEPAKPAEAKPVKTPDTSDTNAGSMAFGAITVAGIVALGVGIALKRREH